MQTIRLSRFGRKRKPFYRIVVAEKHRHVSKKFTENIGFYNPLTKEFKIDVDRAKHLIQNLNLEISDTLRSLIKKNTDIISD